jgi:DNA-binding transcriptional MerR regulator
LGKSPEAFRTISEVAKDLSVPKHVLRFWEGKFSQLRPMKRGGGRRYYRPEDVDLLKGIRQLLYNDGYTIKGVQKILREQGVRFVMEYSHLAGKGESVVVRDIPDVASDAARSAVQPYQAPESAGQAKRLSGGEMEQLRAVLASLEECRKLLAEAKK